MKVSTDACIQGAWAATWLSSKPEPKMRVLDIGAGTGLLSLMLSQQHPQAHVDAVELNENAYQQAKGNFEASLWKDYLTAHHTDLNHFLTSSQQEAYGFIICNPPFFHNHLQARQKARNDARHSVSLSKDALADAVIFLLQEQGCFCVMYPVTEWQDWQNISREKGLYEMASLEVKPRATAGANRMIGLFGKKDNEHSPKETLVIYEEDKTYTPGFRSLMQPYYLAL